MIMISNLHVRTCTTILINAKRPEYKVQTLESQTSKRYSKVQTLNNLGWPSDVCPPIQARMCVCIPRPNEYPRSGCALALPLLPVGGAGGNPKQLGPVLHT